MLTMMKTPLMSISSYVVDGPDDDLNADAGGVDDADDDGHASMAPPTALGTATTTATATPTATATATASATAIGAATATASPPDAANYCFCECYF